MVGRADFRDDGEVMRVLGVALLCVSLAACAPSEERARESRAALTDLWKDDPTEPYPFSGEVPPRDVTPIDGTYVRNVPLADVGRPVPCRRCPPYKIYAGEATLRLERGRFYVEEEGSQFGSEGHFVVDAAAITLFNDPICPAERVTYGYSLRDGVLEIAFRHDPCAFQNLRGKYLTSYPWRLR
ncbi:MAG TPA: hypothetical protein VM573_05780 [Actinomycetota bacterium]|jgi:hypothetical protein|nr:hypothetical protein [Actinomycetota bacterium]